MTVKFWHLRAVDTENSGPDGEDLILPTGGITVAYTICEAKGVDSIFVNYAKCREAPIIIPEKLARREAAIDAVLTDFANKKSFSLPVFTVTRMKIERIMRRPIYGYERFCYKTGREVAAAALKTFGPLEILDLEHPISVSIADWVANSLWPAGPAVGGYCGSDMGFPIDIWQDKRGRWLSDFQPAEGIVVEQFGEGCH